MKFYEDRIDLYVKIDRLKTLTQEIHFIKSNVLYILVRELPVCLIRWI